MRLVLPVLLAACLLPATVRADEDAGAACSKTPTPSDVAELRAISERLRALAPQTRPWDSLQNMDAQTQTIGSIRLVDGKLRCALPTLTGKDRTDLEAFIAKAEKWADAWEADVTAESTARTSTIVPLCQAVWQRDAAKADIARERANPSGVRDLRVLHSAGQAQQAAEEDIKRLTPAYVAFRKHPFKTWQSEGACVAEARAQ